MGEEKIDFSFVHVRKGKMTMGITKKDMEKKKAKTLLLETASEGTLLLDQILDLSFKVSKSLPAVSGATPLLQAVMFRGNHNKCLDASQRNRNGGKVHMWGCDDNNLNQHWLYNAATGQLKSMEGKCLDHGRNLHNGGHVHMWQCDDPQQVHPNRQWDYDSSSKRLRPRGQQKFCLDHANTQRNGGKVHVWSCSHGGQQGSSEHPNRQWSTKTIQPGCKDVHIGNGGFITHEKWNKKKIFTNRCFYH